MNNVYRATFLNPAANPDEIEEEYITADSKQEAELEVDRLIASHPFCDVSLISLVLLDPGQLYHETTDAI